MERGFFLLSYTSELFRFHFFRELGKDNVLGGEFDWETGMK